MNRVVTWLQQYEKRMFFALNRGLNRPLLSALLHSITHMGGASFTILFTLCVFAFAPEPWDEVGLLSLISLAASHIPVAIIKKIYPRLRPYLVLPKTITGKNPLTDHSFPSGHTTAIFSVVIPFLIYNPSLAFLGIPIAVTVGLSRIYLGLHYPSDCIAGALIGTTAGILTVLIMGLPAESMPGSLLEPAIIDETLFP